MGFFDRFKNKVKNIDDEREALENKAADLMDKIGKNETFIKYENEGADKLVELGIKAGIAIASSQTGSPITVEEETIDRIADKGGDIVVGLLGKVFGWIKKQLRK